MSFRVTFYKFAKKVNSTKQPPFGLEPNTIFQNVRLKDNTNILNPTLIVKDDFIDFSTGGRFTPNYVKIEEFERFYYITNMTWIKGMWEIQCKVDVLATYKEEIGEQTLYVTRSAQFANGNIIDTTYPTRTDADIRLLTEASPWDLSPGSESFVVGIAGNATSYYYFTKGQLEAFLEYLFSENYASDLTSLATLYPDIQYNANPLQYITSIKWFPFVITGGTPISSVKVGFVDAPVACKELGEPFLYPVTEVVNIVHRHPQASTRGSYLNYEPFSRYTLTFPPYGELDLDATNIASTNRIILDITVDLRTGGSTLTVLDGNSNRMNRIHADVGVDYQTSQIVSKGFGVAQIANAGAGLIANIASANAGGTVGSILGGFSDYAQSKVPKATTIGSNGGVDALFGSIALQSVFFSLVTEDITRKGRPFCTVRTINTLEGYIQVDKADVEIATAEGEQTEIRSYMEGGFYYE